MGEFAADAMAGGDGVSGGGMEELKRRILDDGLVLGTEIVKVDSFLNHQIDVPFLERIGEAFARRFAGAKVDKILTVESSGISVACVVSRHFGYPPVVFAKKATPSTMTEDYYAAEAASFTKRQTTTIRVSKKYLRRGERVLIIDDFLAHGEAACGLADIVLQAGASVAGVGAVIEKKFQGGGRRIRERGYKLESLAVIERISGGVIYFE